MIVVPVGVTHVFTWPGDQDGRRSDRAAWRFFSRLIRDGGQLGVSESSNVEPTAQGDGEDQFSCTEASRYFLSYSLYVYTHWRVGRLSRYTILRLPPFYPFPVFLVYLLSLTHLSTRVYYTCTVWYVYLYIIHVHCIYMMIHTCSVYVYVFVADQCSLWREP